MELLIVVGWYRMICTLCNGMALPVEGWMRPWPERLVRAARPGAPAVDDQHLAGRVAAGARGQVDRGPADLLGRPMRLSGIIAFAASAIAGSRMMNAVILLSNIPGAIALTRMCSGARRRARWRVSWWTAALLASRRSSR